MFKWKNYIAIVIVVCWVTPIWAQESTESSEDENKSAAIEHFKAAVEHFDAKDFEGALVDFNAAYKLNPSWKLFYNIAHCQAALKLYGLAVVSFERYLAEGGDQVQDARRDEVLAELDRMRKMIGDIEILAPNGLKVYVDDVYRGETPLPGAISVSAGLVHKIVLKDDDAEVFQTERLVRGGATGKVQYTPVAEDSAPESAGKSELSSSDTPAETNVAPSPAPQNRRARLSPVPFIIASGATVLLGGTTIALAAYVGSKKDGVESQDDADKLNTARKVGIGTLVGTAAAGVTAIVLAVFTDFKGERKSAPVTFYGTPQGGGIVLSGQF